MPPHTRRQRQRSIRVLLTAIFIVPLASLLALWGFAASVTVSNAVQEHNFNTEDQRYGGWAQTLFGALAQERLQAFEWLSSRRQVPEAPLLKQQQATDAAVQAFQNGLASSPLIVPTARPALKSFDNELALLKGIRGAVDAGRIPAIAAFADYNSILDSEFHLYGELVVVNNTKLYIQAAASVEAGRAVEMASREVTLVTGGLVSGDRMSKAERISFAQAAATRQLEMTDALRQLDPSLGSGFQRADASSAYQSFSSIEKVITDSIGSKGLVPDALGFGLAADSLFKDYSAAEAQDRLALSSLGTQIGNRLLLEVGLAGGAGLLAVVLSVFLMVRFGRRISRDLTGLQHAALDLAENRLPRVVARLSQGEDVDLAAEAAPPPEGRIAETAQVAAAFSSVQRTAVEAAVGQARLRAGVAQVFRNLAWRSQSLLHRQLTLLDAMERRSSEPETLDELFQLDHLTTRMRRHAEGLIILSGATPGRGWREPVPVMDILRGAIAEVEDYKRVTVICDSQDALIGSAVADVIHLLAELIENATTYSPANTEVTIRAERVANGFAVEIEDRGIGISAQEMATFNDRLANPPEFDIADSNQLGLFVVARLAGKHHIRITLRSSPYGGTSAVALLPHPIVAMSDDAVAFAADLHVIGNGRQLTGSGANGRVHAGSGRELPAGNGRELSAGSGHEPGSGAGRDVATGEDRELAIGESREPAAAKGLDPAGSEPELAGTSRDLTGTGWATPPSLGDTAGNGHELAAAEPQLASSSQQPFDVFRKELPAQADSRDGFAAPSPAISGRLMPYGPADENSQSDSPVWNTAAATDSPRPWLPRRVRQASLAPQLKAEAPAEDIQATASVGEDTGAGGGDGPNPADTQALVQSLQSAMERAARAPDEPADELWPAPTDGSWPSPAGKPDMADWPEDSGGL